ncbi:MAG: SPASM domain-containing protein, partial [Clostridia bacterium]|nr:SPASM domain-containing protein [Clostridia bacterium]
REYNTRGIRISNSIQTNGILLEENWAEFLAENRFLVGLSLDGTREAHDSLRVDGDGGGTYDSVVRCAELLAQRGVEFNILCVVNRFVARYPRKVYQALKKYGYIQFIPCFDGLSGEKKPFSLTPERYGEFLCGVFDRYYEDFTDGNYVSIRNFDNYVQMRMGMPPESCAMMGRCACLPTVEGDGSVFPCDFYVLDEYRLGNVHTHSFDEMIRSEAAQRFTENSSAASEECRVCPYFALCRGGCRRERAPNPRGRSSLCKAYKLFFSQCLARMDEMARILINDLHERS